MELQFPGSLHSILPWLAAGLAAFAGFLGVRRALGRNPVAVLDRLDWLLSGGDRAIRHVAGVRLGPDPRQRLDLYVPRSLRHDAAAPLPLICFVHGGGWSDGDPGNYRFVARRLVRHGFAVALAGYRLGAAGVYPAMLEDGALALRWLVDNARDHGADPERIVLLGHSAGAYNAVMLGLDRRWLAAQGLDPGHVSAVVGLAGPYDFLPLDDPASIAAFAHHADPVETQPVSHAGDHAPPVLLIHGAADRRVMPRHTRTLAHAIGLARGRCEAHVLDSMSHEGLIMVFARPFARDRRVLALMLDFLARLDPDASAPVHGAGA